MRTRLIGLLGIGKRNVPYIYICIYIYIYGIYTHIHIYIHMVYKYICIWGDYLQPSGCKHRFVVLVCCRLIGLVNLHAGLADASSFNQELLSDRYHGGQTSHLDEQIELVVKKCP